MKNKISEASLKDTISPSRNSSVEAVTTESLTLEDHISTSQNSSVKKENLPSPHPNNKHLKLVLRVGVYLSFFVGLGLTILPSFLNCADKAKQSEGRNNIGAISRAQQAFYLNNNKFTNSIPELVIGIPSETINYQYIVQVDHQFVVSYAQAKNSNLKSYMGIVPNSDNTSKTQSINCEVDKPQPLASISPVYQNGTVSCPQGTKLLDY